MDASGCQPVAFHENPYRLVRHDWCSCNRCRSSSPNGDGLYQFRDTYITHKRRHNELRKRNRSDYPELETLEDGDQQVKLPKSLKNGKRAPGYTFREAMDFLNGKENIALRLMAEPVAEIQGSSSENASANHLNELPSERSQFELPDMAEVCDSASREHDEDQFILNQMLPDEEESEEEDESEDEEQDAGESENEENQNDDEMVQDHEDQWNVDAQFLDTDKGKKIQSLWEKYEGIQLDGATASEKIARFLGPAIHSHVPKSTMMKMFESLGTGHAQNFPTAEVFFKELEDAGFSYLKMFTCEEHHPLQTADKRNSVCGHVSQNGGICHLKLNICYRRDSVKAWVQRSMLNPTFSKNIRFGMDFEEEEGFMTDIWGGKRLREIKESHFGFTDQVVLLFGLFVDGFCPFKKEKGNSTWAIKMICYNLPPEIRLKEEYIHLLGLIDGPSEPSCLQQYLEPIINEFKEMENSSSWAYDYHRQCDIIFNCLCINTLQDGRAIRLIAMQKESGSYEACKDCDISGKYIGNAMRYPDAWYMLPENHEYRIHPETGNVRTQMAAEKTHEYILERASKVGELGKDNPFLQGIFGKSVFFNLQYFDVGIGHLTCFMHSLMNFVNKMELHFYDELKKRKKLDTVHRFLRTVHVPTSVGINPRKCFKEKKNGKGIFKKKAHECKDFFLTGLFESCLLAGGLGDNEIKGFIKLRRCLNILCSVKISTDEDYHVLKECERDMWEAQCEIIGLVGEENATYSLHSLGHLPRQVIHWGPLRSTWSYPLESSLGVRIRSVHNRARPAATIAERYIFDSTIKTFNMMTFQSAEHSTPKNAVQPYQGQTRSNDPFMLAEIREYISRYWEEYTTLSIKYGVDPTSEDLWRLVSGPDFIIPEECTGRERQILDSRFCKLEAIEMSSHSTVTFNRTLISKLGADSFGEKMIESKQGNKKCNNFVVHTLSGHPRVASVLNIISCKAPDDQDPEYFFLVKTFQRHEHCEHFGIGNKVYMEPYSTFESPRIIQINKIKAQAFLGSLTLDPDRGHFILMSKDTLWEA